MGFFAGDFNKKCGGNDFDGIYFIAYLTHVLWADTMQG